MNKQIAIGIALACALCIACKKQPAQTEAKYSINGKDTAIKAALANGKVSVTADMQQIKTYVQNSPIAGTAEVKTKENTKGIFIGDIGQDSNPVLCMLTEKGGVEILSLWDAIRTGDFATVGPIDGFVGIQNFSQESVTVGGGGYVTVMAIDAEGKKHEIELYTGIRELHRFIPANGSIQEYKILLSSDWKITYSAGFYLSEIIEKYDGTFKLLRHAFNEGSYSFAYTMTKSWTFDGADLDDNDMPQLKENVVNIDGRFNISETQKLGKYNVTSESGLRLGTELGQTEFFSREPVPDFEPKG